MKGLAERIGRLYERVADDQRRRMKAGGGPVTSNGGRQMPLFAPVKGGDFEIPDEGVVQGVCADVIDLGIVPGFEGQPTHKCEIVFQVAQDGKDGKPLQVSLRERLSMSTKANLRKWIEAWGGRKMTDEQAGAFDLEKLVGVNALLNIVHAEGKQGGKFANIASITPLVKGMPKIAVRDYVRRERKKEEEKAQTQAAPQTSSLPASAADQDVPF